MAKNMGRAVKTQKKPGEQRGITSSKVHLKVNWDLAKLGIENPETYSWKSFRCKIKQGTCYSLSQKCSPEAYVTKAWSHVGTAGKEWRLQGGPVREGFTFLEACPLKRIIEPVSYFNLAVQSTVVQHVVTCCAMMCCLNTGHTTGRTSQRRKPLTVLSWWRALGLIF